MAKVMKLTALFSTLLTVLWAGLYLGIRKAWLLTPAITFGTTAYHFVMRLLTGWVIDLILHNRVNYKARWFQTSPLELKLYKALRVRSWKSGMPSYAPDCFDPGLHSWEEILQAMCQAELVHEGIILLSIVPVLASVYFGAFWVFAVTSFLAALFDAMFVIMQRYNRPRVMKLLGAAEAKKER